MPHDPNRTLLQLRLEPSRQLALAVTAIHVGAVLCGFASDLGGPVQWLLAVCLAVSGHRLVALHATARAARAIVVVAWDGQGRWRLVQRNGRVLDATLERDAYAHPALVALPFRARDGHRLDVLIVPDRVDAQSLRRLRVRLRCERRDG